MVAISASGLTDGADALAAGDELSLSDAQAREMRVDRRVIVGVPHDHHVAVAGDPAAGVDNVSRARSMHRHSPACPDVDPLVLARRAVAPEMAVSEAGSDSARDRPREISW